MNQGYLWGPLSTVKILAQSPSPDDSTHRTHDRFGSSIQLQFSSALSFAKQIYIFLFSCGSLWQPCQLCCSLLARQLVIRQWISAMSICRTRSSTWKQKMIARSRRHLWTKCWLRVGRSMMSWGSSTRNSNTSTHNCTMNWRPSCRMMTLTTILFSSANSQYISWVSDMLSLWEEKQRSVHAHHLISFVCLLCISFYVHSMFTFDIFHAGPFQLNCQIDFRGCKLCSASASPWSWFCRELAWCSAQRTGKGVAATSCNKGVCWILERYGEVVEIQSLACFGLCVCVCFLRHMLPSI